MASAAPKNNRPVSNRGGARPGAGRKKGVPNKLTGDVKAMILAALDEAGGKDYLVKQSADNPTAFMTLVGKVLPMQLTGADGGPIKAEVDLSTLSSEQLKALASVKLSADA